MTGQEPVQASSSRLAERSPSASNTAAQSDSSDDEEEESAPVRKSTRIGKSRGINVCMSTMTDRKGKGPAELQPAGSTSKKKKKLPSVLQISNPWNFFLNEKKAGNTWHERCCVTVVECGGKLTVPREELQAEYKRLQDDDKKWKALMKRLEYGPYAPHMRQATVDHQKRSLVECVCTIWILLHVELSSAASIDTIWSGKHACVGHPNESGHARGTILLTVHV